MPSRRFVAFLIRLADLLTQAAYRAGGGRIGAIQLGYPILLLQTVGRKTGKRRTHALLYLQDGERLVVCASNYGHPRHPSWYLNLRANPRVRAQVGRRSGEYLSDTAAGPERERLWRRFTALRPSTADYQAATARQFPLVVLRPAPPEETETC